MEFQPSELIINKDGSIFHLNILPEDIADDIILVGDPGRVETVAGFFDSVELKKQNREFYTITGKYKNKRISVISTGIGTDNIDIVVNELDALANIDLKTRSPKKEHRTLNLVRIGTSGSLQKHVPVDSVLMSTRSIGFDGLLNFYANRNSISDLEFESAFKKHVSWNELLPSPYVVNASENLIKKFENNSIIKGITISAPGFYGPQGRQLRLKIVDQDINDKIETFEFKGQKITNYEMESSAIFGLSGLLGHNAITLCAIIANRTSKEFSKDYKPVIKNLIQFVLKKIAD
ncbi:MAG: phosphorylase [Bacteroidetes bacterium GWC2_33_15]|nr:MAG: phosphorylase [Bacteroidetes bacterium GWA2_33_15]OFX52178.1 MAG: phosphorylase [Bacteroidetes bacterium GWC2_33_15]OFX64332.1 MAG: phosphorylase [Bacteroidetes bacterium GWB2_32_14]OFX67737.1 MAG: phosphorylase [Bacteroidetes bacterium GWD2_33_33]